MMIHIIRRGSARSTISTTRKVFDEVTNAIHGANMRWRGRSYAASLPSHMPKCHKVRKRVSKDGRQALVESFVTEYRETHAGKFPSVSDAQKQAGGSYYVVRKIVQELEYKSKISSSKSGNENFLGKELPIVSEPLVEVKNMSTGGAVLNMRTQCDTRAVPLNDVGNTSDIYLEVAGGLQTSEKMSPQEVRNPIAPEHSDTVATQGNLLEGIDKGTSHPCSEKSVEHGVKEAQNDHSDFVITDDHLSKREIDNCLEKPDDCIREKDQDGNSYFVASGSHMGKHETKNVSHPGLGKTDNDQEKLSAFKGVMDADHSKHNDGSPDLDKYDKDISSTHTEDAELAKKSTLWGNLKSFAGGLVNMWRKM